MSKQLAPIHEGLYKKIILFENIEKVIVQKTDRALGHQLLTSKYGNYLPQASLSDIIDQNNIHGWLQNAINTAEQRQAALVYALMNDDTHLLEKVKEAYYEIGYETGGYFTATNAIEVYNQLTAVLLDGMPCDKTNQIMNQDDSSIQWKTINCVHKDNWDSQGVDVKLYYQFRTAFINGFIKRFTKDYIYKFSEEYLFHEIKQI